MLRRLVIAALLLGPSIASGEDDSLAPLPPVRAISEDGSAPLYGFVGTPRTDGAVLARQVIPARDLSAEGELVDIDIVGDEPPVAVAQSRTVFLNKNGVTLQPGDNNARTNRSTIVQQQTAFPAWNVSATNWNTVVTCMRELFAAWDIRIVDTDPGNVPHIEAIFGGAPTLVGMQSNVLGVSPFTTDCSIIENSIVFTFTAGTYQMTPREVCETMAQEVAHSYGLDHVLLASDPMTYLPYNGNRTFKDQLAPCGEDVARDCGINGSVCRANQNSVALLTDRLGIADAIAPLLTITSPPNNATVPPGFQVKASGSDNTGITSATLTIDGVQREQLSGGGPFVFETPPTLTDGLHTVIVELSDGKNFKSDTRTVNVRAGAPPLTDTNDPLADGDVVGGCAAGGAGHAGTLLALLAFTARRRRRPARRRVSPAV